MPESKRVMLLINSFRTAEKQFVLGVAKYAELHGPWSFYQKAQYYINPGSHAPTLNQIRAWAPDGIIAADTERLREISRLDVPLIAYAVKRDDHQLPMIVGDTSQCAAMAVSHFLERGYRNFAFCGIGNFYWSRKRYQNFRETLDQAGHDVLFYELIPSRMMRSFETERLRLIDWLRSLPKPIALMTCADDCSQHVAEACKLGNIHVPEEIAVIGVDNDEMVCQTSTPRLSSISFNFENTGFRAALLLDELMSGEKNTGQCVSTKPLQVITRQSTDILAINDRDVILAIRYIRHNAKRLIQTTDVLAAIGCSRRTLHRKFLETLGRSVSDEIKETRIQQITQMLLETDLSISEIAYTLGYIDTCHIARYFQQAKGITPSNFRKQFRK